MSQLIDELTPEQEQQAIIIFYSKLPRELWENGEKPSSISIEATADELQENVSEEFKPLISDLYLKGNVEIKAEASKALLERFYGQEPLRPYVEDAARMAKEPQMAPIPVIIGAYIVILAAIPSEIYWDDNGKPHVKFGHLKDAAVLVEKLTEFAKALYRPQRGSQ
jgi:hypothetical protein